MDTKLEESGWLNKNISRPAAETILMHEPTGTFIITTADALEWQNRLKLVELSNNPKDSSKNPKENNTKNSKDNNNPMAAINIHLELVLRSDLGIERWPIEYKEKLGWRLVCCAIRRKPSQEQIVNQVSASSLAQNFVSIDPRHSRQPYFPHIFIMCLHYGTNPGPLSCTLRLRQNSNNPLYRLNNVKTGALGAAVQV